jgi:hypothetical protein
MDLAELHMGTFFWQGMGRIASACFHIGHRQTRQYRSLPVCIIGGAPSTQWVANVVSAIMPVSTAIEHVGMRYEAC